MLKFYVWMRSWFESEEGQDLIEYALIIGLMIVIAILGLTAMGGGIRDLWRSIATWLGEVGTAVDNLTGAG